ncbi:MAG: DUF1365 domain-containing protein [Gammaproteobacteria bacterium]|nr:DUF1365 domain-containing protein [Gammaproteobacteria bacterium]MYB39511.1 DUF1365 domain-containing protein [Gammaproteobacteria bacterium]
MLGEMVCVGAVVHARAVPRHSFRYPLWMLCVDVERVQSGLRWLLAGDGHLLPPNVIRDHLRRVGAEADGRLLALTAPRSLSGNFNPVNFYFGVAAGGRGTLTGVVLHVTNTPWGERHCYALNAASASAGPGRYRFEFDKAFHVSPFLPVAGRYTLRLAIRDGALGIVITLAGVEAVSARLVLRTRPLTVTRALAASMRRPVQSVVTLCRIYWQALRLRLLGAKFHVHPQRGSR